MFMARPPAPSPKKDSAEATFGEIGKLIDTLTSSPWLKAASTVLSVAGAILGWSTGSQINEKLQEISKKLTEIDAKITEVLERMRNLERVIQRTIDENTKKQTLTSMQSEMTLFMQILANFDNLKPSEVASNITQAQREGLKRHAEATLKLAYDLQVWGPDAVVALGRAYAVFLLARQFGSEMDQDIGAVRTELLKRANTALTIIAEAHYRSTEAAASERDLLNRTVMDIFVGWSNPSPGSVSPLVNYYSQVRGSVDTGFSGSQLAVMEGTINQRRSPVLGSAFPAQPFNFSNDYSQSDAYTAHLNARADRVKELEAQLKETGSLLDTARVLVMTLAVPIR